MIASDVPDAAVAVTSRIRAYEREKHRQEERIRAYDDHGRTHIVDAVPNVCEGHVD
ncbi:MAG: hypothetical protein WB820_06815 [Rhodoplanes sp.]